MRTEPVQSPPAPAPTHARFSPSATRRWLLCPASVPLTEELRVEGRLPERDPDSVHSLRGTLIHALVAEAFEKNLQFEPTGASMTTGIIDSHSRVAGGVKQILDSQGEGLNRFEAVRTADKMLIVMRRTLAELEKRDPSMVVLGDHVEERLDMHEPVETGGTPDFVRVRVADDSGINQVKEEFTVLDLKSGTWRVDATRNPQLMTYAYLAALKHYGTATKNRDARVILGILQPDIDTGEVKADIWETNLAEVIAFVEGEVTRAINAALLDEPEYHPGAEQCRFCRAKPFCPALARLAADLVGKKNTMKKLTDEQIVEFYDNVELLKTVKADLEDNIREGRLVEGFEVKPGYRRGKWAHGESEEMRAFLAALPFPAEQFREHYMEEIALSPSKFKKEEPEAYQLAVETKAITFTETAPRVARTKSAFSAGEVEDLATTLAGL